LRNPPKKLCFPCFERISRLNRPKFTPILPSLSKGRKGWGKGGKEEGMRKIKSFIFET